MSRVLYNEHQDPNRSFVSFRCVVQRRAEGAGWVYSSKRRNVMPKSLIEKCQNLSAQLSKNFQHPFKEYSQSLDQDFKHYLLAEVCYALHPEKSADEMATLFTLVVQGDINLIGNTSSLDAINVILDVWHTESTGKAEKTKYLITKLGEFHEKKQKELDRYREHQEEYLSSIAFRLKSDGRIKENERPGLSWLLD